MALSDAQIDRFSRQIILPQIGATGQQRLLRASVAVVGDGALAEVVALYLAGAGVGRMTLDDDTLRAAIVDLNPDLVLDGGEVDLVLVCNGTLAQIEMVSRRPLIAGGDGWLVVATDPSICAACAARAAVAAASPSELDSPARGVIGSLMSLAALKFLIGIGAPARRVWLQFDARLSTLTERSFEATPDCAICRDGPARSG